ncbi:MAG TPA: tyrosine--tRNA ligase [Candidatus Peribacterales bacterium]|nr:tyrosine--tRNA ligase [Candidatus Peribacterales bacterium]
MENDLLTRAVEKVIPLDLAKAKLASGEKLRVYLGIDPTGARLHLGHSVPLRKLQAFASAGHHVIFLVGSFTARIGDPSGRDTERQPLTEEEIQANLQSYKNQASKILDFSKVELRENHEWLETLTAKNMIRITSSFTKQRLEQRDMFERREKEGAPIHMHEMLYPLLVGYDSVALDVDCEVGGSDQEFNMLAGRTLQQAYGKREKFILTTKLIEGTDGRKMSKTYNNCIYLTDPPNEMYGKVMSIKDSLMQIYFECCTDVPMEEIHKLLNNTPEVEAPKKRGRKPTKAKVDTHPREAKALLAFEIVTIYHGVEAAKKAEEEFNRVFAKKETPEDMKEVKVKHGTPLLDVLVSEGLVKSKAEGKRLIKQKGVKVNDVVVESENEKVSEGVVRVGKRKFIKLKYE